MLRLPFVPSLSTPAFRTAAAAWLLLAGCSVNRLVPADSTDGGTDAAGCYRDEECDDGISCTQDYCQVLDGVGSCRHEPDHGWCEANGRPAAPPDGVHEACVVRRCAPDSPVSGLDGCIWDAAPREGADCNDGTYCNGPDTCQDGACVPKEADANPCASSLTCDPGLDTCVGCTDDSQCAAPKAYCDPDRVLCVECLTDAHCDDGNPCTTESCDANGDCERSFVPSGGACGGGNVCDGSGNCVQCVDDTQCSGATPRCNTASNTCVQCLARNDCRDGNTCTNDRCMGNTCSNPFVASGGACGGGNVCDGSGNCVQCVDDTQCSGATPRCNTASNTCVQCTANAHCNDANPCTNDQCMGNTCRNTNRSAGSACGGGNVCDGSGTCVQCVDDTQCSGATPRCDTTSNTCVQCLLASDCPSDGNSCTNERCSGSHMCIYPNRPLASPCTGESGVCDGSGNCVQCVDDTQCSGATPRCNTASNTCVQCTANAHCDDANPCTNDQCMGNTCSNPFVASGSACGGGNVCDGSGNCVQCVDDTQCSGATPYCDTTSNTCVQCLNDTQCFPGQMCKSDNTCD